MLHALANGQEEVRLTHGNPPGGLFLSCRLAEDERSGGVSRLLRFFGTTHCTHITIFYRSVSMAEHDASHVRTFEDWS
jgi:hypothetical protein